MECIFRCPIELLLLRLLIHSSKKRRSSCCCASRAEECDAESDLRTGATYAPRR